MIKIPEFLLFFFCYIFSRQGAEGANTECQQEQAKLSPKDYLSPTKEPGKEKTNKTNKSCKKTTLHHTNTAEKKSYPSHACQQKTDGNPSLPVSWHYKSVLLSHHRWCHRKPNREQKHSS